MGDRLSAALRGLCYAALGYGLLIHYFVALKWETTEIEELIPTLTINPPLPEMPAPLEGAAPSTSYVKRLLYDMNESQRTQPIPYNTVDKILENYSSLLKNYEYWDDDDTASKDVHSPLLPDGRKSLKIVSFVKLLKKAALSEIEAENGLNSYLQVVLRELRGLSDFSKDIKWDVIGDLLLTSRNEFPDKLKLTEKDVYEASCVVAPLEEKNSDDDSEDEEQENEEDEDDEEAIREIATEGGNEVAEEILDTSHLLAEDDLETQYQNIEGLLGQRKTSIEDWIPRQANESVTAAFNDAIGVLEEELSAAKNFTDESLEEARAKLEEAHKEAAMEVPEEQGHEMECVAEEDVSFLIESGLNALERRQDLRAALLRTLKDLDPASAEGLILDAVLDTEPPLPEASPATAINFQRIMDKPALPQLIAGLDFMVEKAIEYRGELDPEVEKLCQYLNPGALEDGISPAEIMMEFVLQQAGKTKLFIPEGIRTILSQSPKGRKLLAELF